MVEDKFERPFHDLKTLDEKLFEALSSVIEKFEPLNYVNHDREFLNLKDELLIGGYNTSLCTTCELQDVCKTYLFERFIEKCTMFKLFGDLHVEYVKYGDLTPTTSTQS
jgi:hypothetical protein